ncbi:MAG: nickel-dependent hydrogenase large subunit [Magnetococcales bacterium]|nr:nickel-dependent hydrogenase large subunit [Magnetococcales bacterium]
MPRKLIIDPVTRIEGHARVELVVDDEGRVTQSLFKVMDFRGWESFLRGMQAEMMPTLTPRICGTCSVTHHLAAAKAVDKIFSAKPPRAAELVRQVLNFGGYLHSHGVHIFALAGPDLLMDPAVTPPAERNVIGMAVKDPELVRKALRIRSIGALVTKEIGGREIHPVIAVAGGLAAPLSKEQLRTLKRLAAEARELCIELMQLVKNALLPKQELLHSLPIHFHNLGLVRDGNMEFYHGDLRLRDPNGGTMEFSEDDWRDFLHEETHPDSFAKHVFCKNSSGDAVLYRVGPLARVNCCDRIDTPLAQQELEAFREVSGTPSPHTVMYHFARMIELLHAAEKMVVLLEEDEILSDKIHTQPQGEIRSATAMVEAPRGVLIHDYQVDSKGLITQANLIVATQQNIPAINATIGLSAQNFLDADDEALLNAIEFGIRCYDPCLSCATHRIGEMKLDVIVQRHGETLRQVRR